MQPKSPDIYCLAAFKPPYCLWLFLSWMCCSSRAEKLLLFPPPPPPQHISLANSCFSLSSHLRWHVLQRAFPDFFQPLYSFSPWVVCSVPHALPLDTSPTHLLYFIVASYLIVLPPSAYKATLDVHHYIPSACYWASLEYKRSCYVPDE